MRFRTENTEETDVPQRQMVFVCYLLGFIFPGPGSRRAIRTPGVTKGERVLVNWT
jgi:hypothetical protein